jgi:hypothetical protein
VTTSARPGTSSPADPGRAHRRYRPIGDYAFLGYCHTGALVSSDGSVDWLCLPRLDDGSYFGRLLDRERGGWCAIDPADPAVRTSRRYLDSTLMLETEMAVAGGRVRVTDCLTMRPGGAREPYRQLLRVVDGLEGAVDLRIELVPRFDYGRVRPWIRRAGHTRQALGGDDGLVVEGDVPLVPSGLHDLVAEVRVAAGQRLRLSLRHIRPEVLDGSGSRPPAPAELDRRLEQTVAWWRDWSAPGGRLGHDQPALLRSAMVLKALTQATTGAIAAAATTSLPEAPGGPRNWDYRASWVRDSVFALGSLAELGSPPRPTGSAASSSAAPPEAPRNCRSCTGWAASGGCRSRSSSTWRATRAPGRCGSATPPPASTSTTSTGSSWTWPGTGTGRATPPTPTTGGSWWSWSTRPPSAGRPPTAGSGSCAGGRGTWCTPR